MNKRQFIYLLKLLKSSKKILLIVVLSLSFSQTFAATNTVDVFSELNGTWKGTFIGYDLTGKELYRIDVIQTYKTIDEVTQSVQITDIYPSGEIVTGEGKNIAIKTLDGSLNLECEVKKSNGEYVKHKGRVVFDPNGKKHLIWYSNNQKRREMFYETVEDHIDGTYYTIKGIGIHKNNDIFMVGSYRKQY